MGDSRARALERRWKETGALEDEVAYLRERVRAGLLSQERLELLAYCGQPAARAALDNETWETTDDPFQWTSNLLARWGQIASVRAAVAAARAAIRVWQTEQDATYQLAAIQAAEDWVLCPCVAHGQEASAASDRGDENPDLESLGYSATFPKEALSAAYAAALTATAAAAGCKGFKPELRAWEDTAGPHSVSGAEKALGGSGEALAAAKAELILWALGTTDPVAERRNSR